MTQIEVNESTGMVTVRIFDQYGLAWEDEIPVEDFFPDWEKVGRVDSKGAA